jgi:hypothetical protein
VRSLLEGAVEFVFGAILIVMALAAIGGILLLGLWSIESWHNYVLSSVVMLGATSVLLLIHNIIWG